MYSIGGYGDMIADRVRTDAYARALHAAVTPQSVVLEIGTGTGFFALLACQFGARHVYAVEPGDAIGVARTLAVANGCADRIEFMQARSTAIELPERADVIISDLRGVLPYFEDHLFAIADARRRLLAPGGVLIPRSDTLWLACVEAAESHAEITAPWSGHQYGLDLRAARDLRVNSWTRARFKPEQMITRPAQCASLDYSIVDDHALDAEVLVSPTRAGLAHGLCVWFSSTLMAGIQFSNSPDASHLIYGQAFFPWPEPVALGEGDTIAVRLRSNRVLGENVWSWETRIGRELGSGKSAVHFKQSEFFGEPLSLGQLRKLSAAYVPELNDDGRIDGLILRLMDEKMAQADISRRVASEFPARFARWEDALRRVGELSTRYSR
jgi:protein arginine N-methyltransferase 1